MNDPIIKFDGEFRWLSNFINTEGCITTEHIYQSEKTTDPQAKIKILMARTPGKAKRLGGKVEMRSDWDDVKVEVMWNAVWVKFQQEEFRELLKATGDREIIEGNKWHDNFWGNCTCNDCKNIPGQNALGKMIMEIREMI